MGFPGSRRRIALVWLLVGAAHALLIALLGAPTPVRHAAASGPRVTLRLIPRMAPSPAPAPPVPPVSRPPTRSPGTRTTTPPRFAAPPPAALAPAPEGVTTATNTTPAEPAASEPDRTPSLMDTEATRRAIRASAGAPSLGAQLARSREEPDRPGAGERLANDVRAAGKGDCLKGDYPGAGMRLLSLPFLAAAAVSGRCAK